MSCLSMLYDGIAIVLANPVYFLRDPDIRVGSKLTFEVLEADAGSLRRRLNQKEHLILGAATESFTAQITSIEPCESTVMALSLLRHKPTVRCELTILSVGIPKSID
jgi:hypothetical protein